VQGSGSKVQGSGVQGPRSRVQGLGFGVSGSHCCSARPTGMSMGEELPAVVSVSHCPNEREKTIELMTSDRKLEASRGLEMKDVRSTVIR